MTSGVTGRRPDFVWGLGRAIVSLRGFDGRFAVSYVM